MRSCRTLDPAQLLGMLVFYRMWQITDRADPKPVRHASSQNKIMGFRWRHRLFD
jgi:hypothetical protein